MLPVSSRNEPVRRTVWLSKEQREELYSALRAAVDEELLPASVSRIYVQDALAQLQRANKRERITLRLVAGYNTAMRLPEDAIPVHLSDYEALACFQMPVSDRVRRLVNPDRPMRGWRMPPLDSD